MSVRFSISKQWEQETIAEDIVRHDLPRSVGVNTSSAIKQLHCTLATIENSHWLTSGIDGYDITYAEGLDNCLIAEETRRTIKLSPGTELEPWFISKLEDVSNKRPSGRSRR